MATNIKPEVEPISPFPPPHPESSTTPQERLPLWRIIACTIAMCGVQVCYAAQINQGTPELLLLGISERAVSFAWLAGPISGLVVQPLVGRASDGCTSILGRRRPFLIAGSLLTSAALLLFSNAKAVAKLLAKDEAAQNVALGIAVVAFFLLDFSIQAVQAPLRALVTDVVPKRQRAVGNAYVGVFSGLGLLIGGIVTSLNLTELFPVFATDVQALFAIAALVLMFTVCICVAATKEIPLTEQVASYAPVAEDGESDAPAHPSGERIVGWRGAMTALRFVPRPFWRVFAVQLCAWCGFFCLFVYVNTWVGRNVFLGDGTAEPDSEARKTFEEGVRFGGKGNALMALIALVYALGLPEMFHKFGIRRTYAFSQIVEATSLLAAPFIRGRAGQEYPSAFLRAVTIVDMGLFGVVWATTMGAPWTLVGDALESHPWYKQRVGLFQTLFNASQSFPQLVVAATIAPVTLAISGNDPAVVMFAGGVLAAIGAVLVVVLRVDVFERSSKQIGDNTDFDTAEETGWFQQDDGVVEVGQQPMLY